MDSRLLEAARFGDVGVLETVAEEDADLLLGATPFRNTALHIAVTFQRQEFVEKICALKPGLLREQNVKDETPLHVAAIVGSHRAVVFFVVLAAANDVERGDVEAIIRLVDQDGNNALHAALLNGHPEVAKVLVLADHRLAACINKQKESPLYLAAMRGFQEIVQLLLQCDRSCHKGPRGQTALHAAVMRGHRGIGRKLLETRTEISKEKDDEGKTPLHHAVTWGDLEMVRLLLKHDSSAAYVADTFGCSPVHLCATGGRVDIFVELFSRCPDAVDAVDAEGRNALHIAIESKNKLVRYLLITPGFERLLNQRDNAGKTALHLAVEEHNPVILQQLLRFKRVDQWVTDRRGLTAPQSFYADKKPHLCSAWYKSHSVIRDAWAKDDESKLNFVKRNIHRMESRETLGGLPKNLSIVASDASAKVDESKLNCVMRNIHLMESRETWGALPENLSIVAGLIATVTFAAAFTVPGGYVSDAGSEQGLAVLSRKAAVKVFLIFDTISMCCSLSAAYLYSATAIKEVVHQWVYALLGRVLVSLSFVGMIIAFASGIYAVMPPDCLWLGHLICLLCLILPSLALGMNGLKIFLVRRLMDMF